jgi:pSer/pThr/pTyr-binding forkhead associated (FHA) protein
VIDADGSLRSPHLERAAERRAKLVVREPGLDPVTVFLDRPLLVLGRGSECDARLHSPYISRRHAIVETVRDGHVLRDLDSANGTSVNGEIIAGGVTLSHGDEIKLSNVSLWYLVEIPLDEDTPVLEPRARRGEGLLLALDEETHRAWVRETGAEVALAPNEFKLVQYLFGRRGGVASREELGAYIWGEDRYDLESLYRLVQRVKEKLEPDAANPRYLISHRGIGYSLQISSDHEGSADRSSRQAPNGGPP